MKQPRKGPTVARAAALDRFLGSDSDSGLSLPASHFRFLKARDRGVDDEFMNILPIWGILNDVSFTYSDGHLIDEMMKSRESFPPGGPPTIISENGLHVSDEHLEPESFVCFSRLGWAKFQQMFTGEKTTPEQGQSCRNSTKALLCQRSTTDDCSLAAGTDTLPCLVRPSADTQATLEAA
jgi:hypothetical protein